MTSQSVCAVIVTYHPSARMVENLRKVFAQVQALVLVDNDSNPDQLEPFRLESGYLGIFN